MYGLSLNGLRIHLTKTNIRYFKFKTALWFTKPYTDRWIVKFCKIMKILFRNFLGAFPSFSAMSETIYQNWNFYSNLSKISGNFVKTFSKSKVILSLKLYLIGELLNQSGLQEQRTSCNFQQTILEIYLVEEFFWILITLKVLY